MLDDLNAKLSALNARAKELEQQGNFREAVSIALEACKYNKDIFGAESSPYTDNLHYIGKLYLQASNYENAQKYYRKAIKMRKKKFNEDPLPLAESFTALGVLYSRTCKYHDSKSSYRKALKIYDTVKGKEFKEYAQCLNNLGVLYEKTNEFVKAESLYSQASDIMQRLFGDKHVNYAMCLNNLGAFNSSIGDYHKAEESYLHAYRILRNSLGDDHAYTCMMVNNLGTLHFKQGDYVKAETYYIQALEKRKHKLGEDHPDYAQSLLNMGSLYFRKNQYDEAESCFTKARDKFVTLYGVEHPQYAIALNNLGELYKNSGKYSESEELLSKAVTIKKNNQGQNHPGVIESLMNLAKVLTAEEYYDKALETLLDAFSIQDILIEQIFSIGSENQRMLYLRMIKTDLDILMSFILFARLNNIQLKIEMKAVYELVLRRKTIADEIIATQRDLMISNKHPEFKMKIKELTSIRMMIAQNIINGPGSEGVDTHQTNLKNLCLKRDNIEKELAERIPEMRYEANLEKADINLILANLPPKSILIEYVKFNIYDFQAIPKEGQPEWKEARYVAFICSSDDPGCVRMIDLGEADKIDRLINEYRLSVMDEDDERRLRSSETHKGNAEFIFSLDSGKSLRELTFDSCISNLDEDKDLFIAPDGDLCRLPFQALPSDDGQFLIDKYKISYLSVGRDLVRFGVQNGIASSKPLIVADPDFEIGNKSLSKDASANSNWRQSRYLNRSNLNFSRLPGTRYEGEAIASIMGVKALLDGEVLEKRLKSVNSPSIMHLATHGFFMENQINTPDYSAGDVYENPLLRSGLALAGANTFIKGGKPPKDAEDGILTADDVAVLNLTGTELVVLSACDTGLGESNRGEGVFGLRRSFMLAGTKTLVMSLWKIPDLATPILMERFYKNLINRKMGRAESLREAQIFTRDITIGEIKGKWLTDEMIDKLSIGNEDAKNDFRELTSQPDDFTPFKDPAYWGAFICQGDPGPL
jgi:CHAT domain-containing protein/tetratricopeptide (TPR) repeat protein